MTTQTNNALLPVYLVAGEDELKRQTVIQRLHSRLEKMGDLSFNSETFSGATCTGEEIVTAANTLPFASPIRLVEVYEVEKLKKADSEMVIEYLSRPCGTTVLALIGEKVAKNTRLYKAVASFGKTAIIDCTPFKRKDMGSVVRSMAVGHGITFTEGAASTLLDLVGTNTVALDGEIRKLALSHRGTDPVNENEVLSMVSFSNDVKPWEFVDAFAARNANRCIYILHRMTKISVFGLLSMCTTRIRELISVKSLIRRGDVASISKVINVAPWKVKFYQTWVKNFSMQELIEALQRARDAEQAMKSGADKDEVFLRWVLSVCKKH